MGDDASGNPSTHRHTYVIDRDHRVVYMDQAAHRAFPRGQVGSICYEAFRGASDPCDDCPWHGHESNSGDATQTVIFSARRDRWYEITCLEVDWFDRGPCVLFSGRPVDDRSRSLFSTLREPSSYNELFEINVTGDTYKVLYHEPGKYAMPPLSGELGAMFDDVLRNMINPEDRERFQRFWDFDTLLERIEEEDGALRGEFRKLRCDGSWGGGAQTVVPVKRGEGGETVVMCFIADIDAEVRAREEHAENAQIRQLRERDQLTGIYNAATFYAKASALLEAHPERCHEAIYLDIEHFKLFNEWHGREAGDEMLRAIANRLSNLAERYEGVAGYLGGDDFALVLPHGIITEDAVDRQLKLPPFDSEDAIGFRPAIGVCSVEEAGRSISTACDHAMLAMATVKNTYAKRVAWYEESMSEELKNEAKLLLEVKQALKNREFVPYWQPQCSTRTGRIVGLEALVRWQHPERGVVMPGAFIPVLERSGFIASLDLYVWDEVCRHLRSWIDRGCRPIPVSVNISRADLYAIDVVDTLEGLVGTYGLDHSLLELEITESAYAEDRKMAEAVSRLKALGFTILMDDFGSGYSSLNMLKDITVDILKIDMGFLNRNDNTRRSESILEAVVSMARLMDLRIIAEGAETKEQVGFLQDIGCDYAQGYYFHRPMDTEHLEALLAQPDAVDFRGVLAPMMELIDMDALLNEDETSRTLVDNLIGGMAVYAVYPDRFELLQVNNSYYRVTGCNAVDLHERQRYIFRQVHPDDRGLVMSLFEQAEQHPVSGSEGTIRRYRLCGDLMWLHMKVFFLRREQDRSIFFASLSDVTGQKEQELELRSSQTALNDVLGLPSAERALDDMSSENRQVAAQIFLENVPGGLIGGYCEEGFPILFANEEIARMAGYDTSAELIEALDGKVGNSIHPDDLPHVMKDIGPDYYEGLDYTTQYRMPRKDGSWFWVADHGRVVRTKNGRLAIASVCLDIDDSVRMQQELALDDEMLHRIILQASLNVWIYDVEHDRLTFQNLSSDGLTTLLASADRRTWRRAVGAVLEDWTDTTPAERIGRTVRTVKDAEAVKSFLDFDAMLARFDDGVLFDSLEYRQEDERGERWMELGYRLIRIEAGGDVYAYLSVTDIDRRKRRELDLEDKARHDALTGLLNRQTGAALLPEALTKTLRKGTAGAFVIIDLDDFKLVNDRHGHLSGDTALADVGLHLRSAFRKNDLVCRWGGDEFIVYCDDITRASLARRVGALCGKPWTTKVRGGTTIEVSASAGVVLVPKQGTEFKTVYDRADAALYRAKSQGKAHFCFFEADKDS